MFISNHFHKFFIILFLSSNFIIKANYYTREIDLANDFEVTEVAKNLFFNANKMTDDQKSLKPDLTPEEYQQKVTLAKNYLLQEVKSKSHIFLCISSKDKKIYGILYCKYDHRKYNTVEYMQSKVYPQNNINYYFYNNFTEIMLYLTQYAEIFYKKMSMNHIVIHVLSKDNASFYSQHGYVLLSTQQANDLYYTTTENFLFTIGLPLLIPFWPFYILYKMCDWGIYYKKL